MKVTRILGEGLRAVLSLLGCVLVTSCFQSETPTSTMTPDDVQSSSYSAEGGYCPPEYAPCDERPLHGAEMEMVATNLNLHYLNSWGNETCDRILGLAYDRLYVNTHRWLNAPPDYWGANHSYERKILLTNKAFIAPKELAKTQFHEAAHL